MPEGKHSDEFKTADEGEIREIFMANRPAHAVSAANRQKALLQEATFHTRTADMVTLFVRTSRTAARILAILFRAQDVGKTDKY